MRDDYSDLDWSKAVRGKYSKRLPLSSRQATLDPDVARIFRNDEAVNHVLREHIRLQVDRAADEASGNAGPPKAESA